MTGSRAVVGVFEFVDDTLKAIRFAQEGRHDYRVFTPVPNHEIQDLAYPEKSNVRMITLTGAVTGLIFGFALAILCSLDWPLRVSAKDIVSVPGFVVIGYECTILFGAIATLIALFHFCRLPDIVRKAGYDPRFSGDRFGVVISCDAKHVDEVKRGFENAGAEEVQVRDAL